MNHLEDSVFFLGGGGREVGVFVYVLLELHGPPVLKWMDGNGDFQAFPMYRFLNHSIDSQPFTNGMFQVSGLLGCPRKLGSMVSKWVLTNL